MFEHMWLQLYDMILSDYDAVQNFNLILIISYLKINVYVIMMPYDMYMNGYDTQIDVNLIMMTYDMQILMSKHFEWNN